ncbi:MAG: MFS transporter [Actinomycetota bacterium]|nr:MFS transporter [Actinomycetota bacterium]
MSEATRTGPSRLRDLLRGVPRSGRLLLLGVAVDALGVGLTLPFAVVYLREVRGIPLSTVGLLLSLPPAVALVLLGPIGLAIDRLGARRVQMTALTFCLLGQVAMVGVRGPATAAAALVLSGIGHAAFFPAIQALVATAIAAEHRQRFYGLSFTLLNAGIGLGGIVSGLVVDVHRAWTFELIYLVDAASYLIPLLLLFFALRGVGGPVQHVVVDGQASPVATYAVVLRDKVFRRFLAVTFMGAFIGYAQLEAGWTAFARIVGGVSTREIGLAFAANTAVIVLLQLPVVQRIEGHRRTRLLMVMAGIWASAWALAGVAGLVGGALAAVLLIASAGIFGAGETFQSPVVPAVVNDLASDHLRGRYNAANSVAFQIAAVAGPSVAGLLIAHGLAAAYIVMLLVGCLVLVGLLFLLERRIPAAANGVR